MNARTIGRRRILGFAGALAAPFAAPAWVRGADAETHTLRLSVNSAATSAQGIASVRYASAVGRKSNGQLKIEVYPSGQIAKEQESLDGMSTGIIDFGVMSTSWLISYFPRYQVFDLPFLFRDRAAAYRVIDGAVGEELFGELEAKGIVGLAWGIDGFKEIETVSRTISTPEDMKGMRVRVAGGALNVATYQALGAIPVGIDLNEAYTALSQKTVEAVDVPLLSFAVNKFFNVAKHVAMSNHIFSVIPLLMSKRKLDSLPAGLRKILRDEAKALTPEWRAVYDEELATAMQTLRGGGVAFNETQYPAFRKAVEPVYTAFAPKLGADFLDRVTRASNGDGRRR